MTNTEHGQPPHPEPEEHRNVTIIVNGRKKEVPRGPISFEEVVNIAFNNHPPTGENVLITVAYSGGPGDRDGTLLAGDKVPVVNGMIFNVTATDKS